MTKNDYLSRLADALKAAGIADIDDILSEYEDHFAFKLADGYSEAEIAHKLGDPALLAAQFEDGETSGRAGGGKFIRLFGLAVSDLFAGLSFGLLWLWGIIMLAATVVFAGLALGLLFGLKIEPIIPPMPYWTGAMFGLSFIALAVLTAVGTSYFVLYLRQAMRWYGRFHANARAATSGRKLRPPVTLYPRLAAPLRRRLRRVGLISLAAFAICFVLTLLAAVFSAQALEFWHHWRWFGYSA